MYRLAICDDTERDAEHLHLLCARFKGKSNLSITVFLTGADLLAAHSKEAFDIILLDVDMPHTNGLQIGKVLHKASPQTIIIFVTSYPQYAIEAYDCEAFHYLLKPCDEHKLFQVLNRAIGKLKLTMKFHLIKTQKKALKLRISDIYYVECCRKHIIYHTKTTAMIP